MNGVYFACRDCKNYIDAGYRWPVSTLFPNQWEQFPLAISVEEVLAHSEYWGGVTAHPYLAAALPAARRFLLFHRTHRLLFGDTESFMDFDDLKHGYLEWLDEGSLEEPKLQTICLEPRYFAEHQALRYKSWESVEKYCSDHTCGWSCDAAATEVAKQVFLRAVETSSHDGT